MGVRGHMGLAFFLIRGGQVRQNAAFLGVKAALGSIRNHF